MGPSQGCYVHYTVTSFFPVPTGTEIGQKEIACSPWISRETLTIETKMWKDQIIDLGSGLLNSGRAIQNSCVVSRPISFRLHRVDIDQCLNEKKSYSLLAGCYQLCKSSNVCGDNTCLPILNGTPLGNGRSQLPLVLLTILFTQLWKKCGSWSQQRGQQFMMTGLNRHRQLQGHYIVILDTRFMYQYHHPISPW